MLSDLNSLLRAKQVSYLGYFAYVTEASSTKLRTDLNLYVMWGDIMWQEMPLDGWKFKAPASV